jgi:hypothetical protein
MKNYLSDPIRIPASSRFIKGFTGKVNKMYFGSIIVLILMMSAFVGSFFSVKLIYFVPIIGTAYWGGLFLFFAAVTLLIIPKKDRSGVGFKFYGLAMLTILCFSGLALVGVFLCQSNILLQRVFAAASLSGLLIPVWIWNTSRKIKIETSLEGESGKET